MITHLDLFSGIGGFALGFQMCGGFKTVAFCEIEPYAQKVLAKNFPNIPIYSDVKELKGDELISRFGRIDVVTAGFPCQDISNAGRQNGITGERSGLFYEATRIIGEVRPRFVLLENVSALLSGGRGDWMGAVLAELAEVGYDCEWHCIQAADFGAPHIRDRVWILAYPSGGRRNREPRRWAGVELANDNTRMEKNGVLANTESGDGDESGHIVDTQLSKSSKKQLPTRGVCSIFPDTSSVGLSRQGASGTTMHPEPYIKTETINAFTNSLKHEWGIEPDVGRVADGIPRRVDRLRGLGNAVIPQIPAFFGEIIRGAI